MNKKTIVIFCLVLLISLVVSVSGRPNNNFKSSTAKIWHDNHFEGLGSSQAYGIVVDKKGYVYFSGITSSDGDSYGFIVKLNKGLNEVWYKRYFETNGYGGIHRLAFASDGNIVAGGDYIDSGDGQAYMKLMKINPKNGNIIWETIRARGNSWLDIWADGIGPVIDSNDDIYYAQLIGNHSTRSVGPIEILKFDSNGNVLWNVTEDLIANRTRNKPIKN